LRERDNSRKRPRHQPRIALDAVPTLAVPPDLTAAEASFWTYYAAILAAVKVLTMADRDTLSNHCIALAQVAEIRAEQGRPGYQRVIQSGVKTTTNPLDVQLRSWLLLARQSAAELGLTPVSRTRIAPVGTEKEIDELEAFIQTPLRRVK
jgi:P27 family predicted phage terminase small subunit